MLARASLRHFSQHPWQLVLLLLGIMLGVAVVAAIAITSDSARHSFLLAEKQIYGEATHRVVADRPIDQALYTRLQRHPADWPMAPQIHSRVRAMPADHSRGGMLLRLLGVDPLRESTFRPNGAQLVQADLGFSRLQQDRVALLSASVATELGLKTNDRLSLSTTHGPAEVRIAGLLDDQDKPQLRNLLLMDIGQAQQLLRLDSQISSIDLKLRDNEREAVRALLPPAVRLEATALSDARDARLTQSFFFNLRALSLLALVIGLFLVFNSVWFSLQQRQPVYAQFRALGLEGAVLQRYLLLEVTLIATIASCAGVILGAVLASSLLERVLGSVAELYGTRAVPDLLLEGKQLLLMVITGVGGSLLAAAWPCYRIGRTPPRGLMQLSQQEYQLQGLSARSGWIAGLLLLVALMILLLSEQSLMLIYLAVTALLLAGALILPLLLRCLAQLLARALQSLGHPLWQMIPRDISRSLSRTGIAAMALMIAVAATVGMSSMVGSFRQSVQLWLEARLNADLYVTQQQDIPGQRGGLSAQLIGQLEALPGIATRASLSRVKLQLQGQAAWLYASEFPSPMHSAYRFRRGEDAQIWQQLAQGAVVISEPLASRLQLKEGQALLLNTPQGAQSFLIAGVYYDFGSIGGRLMMTRASLQRFWGEVKPYSLALYLQPEDGRVSSRQLEAFRGLIQQRLIDEDLQLIEAQQILQRSIEVFERTFLVTDLLRLMTVLVAFIGILSSLMALQLSRQHEVSLLKALGFSRRELIALLLGQSLLLGLIAGLFAIPLGELLGWILTEEVQLRAFGWSIPYLIDWQNWPGALGLALLAALLASIWPAWRFARLRGIRRWE
ncbi:FtsX-like permease family protein [Marinobacterium jannaschii]|uniref:FtsX-like permease family protein n=1 Tax=Marinobacterium jannaschii TaxID=64970 RepID=UPI0004881215|nr:ABC transporter permease [Marinobacterium jannaschii]